MLRFLARAKVRCAYIPHVMVKMRLGGASNRSLGNIIRLKFHCFSKAILAKLAQNLFRDFDAKITFI